MRAGREQVGPATGDVKDVQVLAALVAAVPNAEGLVAADRVVLASPHAPIALEARRATDLGAFNRTLAYLREAQAKFRTMAGAH